MTQKIKIEIPSVADGGSEVFRADAPEELIEKLAAAKGHATGADQGTEAATRSCQSSLHRNRLQLIIY